MNYPKPRNHKKANGKTYDDYLARMDKAQQKVASGKFDYAESKKVNENLETGNFDYIKDIIGKYNEQAQAALDKYNAILEGLKGKTEATPKQKGGLQSAYDVFNSANQKIKEYSEQLDRAKGSTQKKANESGGIVGSWTLAGLAGKTNGFQDKAISGIQKLIGLTSAGNNFLKNIKNSEGEVYK